MTGAVIEQAPANAFNFRVTDFELAEKQLSDGIHPVKILARSVEPVDHWHWGRVIHDFDGMRLSKPKIAIDWMHGDELIGYLDSFSADAKGLHASGALVTRGDDQAAEIVAKAAAGVPYEASINFAGTGIKIEDVPAGVTVTVNGGEFQGPGVVIREWPLRGVAICPYGADQNTAAEFSAKGRSIEVAMVRPSKTTNRRRRSGVVRFSNSGFRVFK